MIDYQRLLKYTSDLKILYVEDDEDIQKNTVEILECFF